MAKHVSQLSKKVVALATARLRERLYRIRNLAPCGLFHHGSDLLDGVVVPLQQVRKHLLSFTQDFIACIVSTPPLNRTYASRLRSEIAVTSASCSTRLSLTL